jgi:hypothetical protein
VVSFTAGEDTADPGVPSLKVGIGTADPRAKLDIRDVPTTGGGSGSPLGTDLWFRVGDGGNDGRVWVEYGAEAGHKAPVLVLSNRAEPPRLQFQQTGTFVDLLGVSQPRPESTPAFVSWIGQAKANSSDLAIMNGNVGIGTTDPQARLHLFDDTGVGADIHSEVVGAGGAGLRTYFARRSDAEEKLAVGAGDNIGAVSFHGYDGTKYQRGARIVGEAGGTGSWNTDSTPAYIKFYTTPNGSNAEAERMRIAESGSLGIGTDEPATALDLNGALSIRGMAVPAVSPAGQGRIYLDSTQKTFMVSEDAGVYRILPVIATRRQPLAVWREADAVNVACVPSQLAEQLPR